VCLTVGSVFSGIGGIELGLERCGMKVLWQVEKDPYCRAVLRKHWPNTEQFDDICTSGGHNLSPVDVLCGGFPCQDISLAGKGGGLEGERSGLWFEYVRIIRELRPRFVLVENVSALLTRGLDRVLGSLAEIGYDAEWDCIPASYVGAPHRRDRIWIVAYPFGGQLRLESGRRDGEDRSNPPLTRFDGETQSVAYPFVSRLEGHAGDGDRTARRSDETRSTGASRLLAPMADTNKQRLERRHIDRVGEGLEVPRDQFARGRSAFGAWWTVEPSVGRVANGVPSRVDRLKCLGNAVVPQAAEERGRRIVELARDGQIAPITPTAG
jgi:DNA (cytosine-5)-methyltransferase 1